MMAYLKFTLRYFDVSEFLEVVHLEQLFSKNSHTLSYKRLKMSRIKRIQRLGRLWLIQSWAASNLGFKFQKLHWIL